MPIIVDGVYEGGVLKPVKPLPLAEHQEVRITVEPDSDWVRSTYGICGWKGDPEVLRRLALSPEFDIEEEA
jgi:predicted DNA-binding antitoxin AbrB/MazE fold protein